MTSGRPVPPVAGVVASPDGPRTETATAHTVDRHSPLPVQGVNHGAQHTEYRLCRGESP